LPAEIWSDVSQVDDSVVALLSLDLKANGLADGLDPDLWGQHMEARHLYSENWLIAYEALIKGWLPSKDGSDYVAVDDFFGLLAKHAVMFYDISVVDAASETDWLTAYLGG